jgi:hypothetical protein
LAIMNVTATNRQGTGNTVTIDKVPDKCPLCHKGIEPKETGANAQHPDWVEKLLRCPRTECDRLFIARYKHQSTNPNGIRHYVFDEAIPTTVIPRPFNDIIREVSPKFCEIFDQAHEGEGRSLALISGPGYRKALEFLIKDYLLKLHPTEGDEIKAMQLGACIKKYIKSEELKDVASRAAWLGNDETHYVRVWADKDLKDLKDLIELTINWIEIEKRTAALRQSMPQPAKSVGTSN